MSAGLNPAKKLNGAINRLPLRQIRNITAVILGNPLLLTLLFLVFLLARNWRVFLVTDVYDGFSAKTLALMDGFSRHGISDYIKNFALQPYNQHFTPVWFLFFFGLAYIDASPWLLGTLSFAAGAWLLYLIYRITCFYFGNLNNGKLYALLCAIIFSGSTFFIETIAWKWQLALMLSTDFYLFSLLIVLERRHSLKWQTVNVLSLLVSIWTFGLTWIGGWGLVLFMFIRRGRLHKGALAATSIATFIGMLSEILTNTSSVHGLNIKYFIANLPALITIETANILSNLLGVFRFIAVDHIHISGILAITIGGAITYAYIAQYWKQPGKLDDKQAMILSLLLVYILTLALSLLRIMPVSGIVPTSDIKNYIFGNRYMFIYSIPLFLAVVLFVGSGVVRLSKPLIYIFLSGALLLGIAIEYVYPTLDPAITGRARNNFYNLTVPAVNIASQKKLVLPNLDGDLFSPGIPTKLDQAVFVRKQNSTHQLSFKLPKDLSPQECYSLRQNQLITSWLNEYNRNWCKR